MIMRHLGNRLVTQSGTGLDQSPAQINILTSAHGFVEATDIA